MFFQPSQAERKVLETWRISTFWVMMIGYIGYYLCRGNLSAALPLISTEFGYTNTQLGLIMTFSELVYALGKFSTGPLADTIGGKKIFLLGLLGAILSNLWFSQVQSIFMFTLVWCVCRFFLSMGWGGVLKTMGAWYEPEKSGTIMGMISTNFQIGGGLAILYCALLLKLGFSWQGMFIIPALTGVVIWVWALLASKESPDEVYPGVLFGQNVSTKSHSHRVVEATHTSVRDIAVVLLKQPIFRSMLTFSFLTTLLRSIFLFWTAKFLVDIGMKESSAILKSAIFPFLGIIGTVILGWYTDRYARGGDRARAMWMTLTGLVVSLLLIAWLVPHRENFQNAIVCLVGASGFFLIGPYSMTSGCLSLDIAGSKGSGTASGLIDGVGYIGGSFAAWGAGFISDQLGWEHVFYFLSFVAMLAVLSAYHMSLLFQKRSLRSFQTSAHSEPCMPSNVELQV